MIKNYDEDMTSPYWHEGCDFCGKEWDVMEINFKGMITYYCKDCYESLRRTKL